MTKLKRSDFVDFLGEYEAIFETALGRESGHYVDVELIDEKKPRVKNRVTLSLYGLETHELYNIHRSRRLIL
jgi:hypothetical protein